MTKDLKDRIVEYSDTISRLLSEKADATDRATAAEADAAAARKRVRELEAALDTITRGRYDGLEVTHYAAIECRNIARAALGRAET
jgi:hypothetical protein